LGSGATTGPTHPGGAASVVVNIPTFPVLEESLYSQYPDPAPSRTLSGNFNVNGIYYAPGDLNISGTYSGNGMIVTHGKVTITGDLLRSNSQSSLVIVSFGNLDSVGIEVAADKTNEVCALLYTPNTILMDNNALFRGSLVCNNVVVNNNAVVTYDADLHDNLPNWMTTVVKIKSWKESYPVF